MRVALIALGSRGDVQPYIALAAGLYNAGHTVRIVTHENYAGLVQAQGLEFWPAPIRRSQLTADRLAQAIAVATDDAAMRKRTAELGATIRAEDGVGRAVALIQHHA